MFPSSSFFTTTRSMSRMMSASLSLLNSSRTSPWNLGSSKPTINICTGPIAIGVNSFVSGSHALQDLLLLHLELGVGEDPLRVQLRELLQLVQRLGGHAAGCRRGGRGRVLLFLLCLFCTRRRAALGCVVRHAADHRGGHEWASAPQWH